MPCLGRRVLRRLVCCSGVALAASVPLVASALVEQSSPVKVPVLEAGYPLLVSDLPALETRCFALELPHFERVRIVASVVGLAGSPILLGGWEPQSPVLEAAKDAGFQTLVQDLVRISNRYHLCVRTFSSQGCDALLTAIVADTADAGELPPLSLWPSYPAIWPLDLSSMTAPRSLRFVLHADDLEDVRVSVVPISGEVDVDIYLEEASAAMVASPPLALAEGLCAGAPWKSLPALGSPDVVDVLHTQLRPAEQLRGSTSSGHRVLCVRMTASGDSPAVAALNVGPRLPGPFLAHAVPTGGRFFNVRPQGHSQNDEDSELVAIRSCESMRLLVNSGADITVTATSEDGSRLRLRAALASELLLQPLSDRWTGETPPGGAGGGAVLVLRGTDVSEAAAALGEQGEVTISLSVCRFAATESADMTRFWVTAVTDTDLVTLEDGLPFPTAILGNESEHPWRDFRFFVPGGLATPHEITVSAVSSGWASLVADTRRHEYHPFKYRWATHGNSSHAVLRLTTDRALAKKDTEVHLVDCLPPCFVYVSASARAVGGATEDADLEIQVQTDTLSVKPLLEGQDDEETLEAEEAQVFRYRTPNHGTSAVLFSLSVSKGSASFEVSASSAFPADSTLTTRPADDVVLLEPFGSQYKAAADLARPLGHSPVLFVRVKASKAASTEFAMVGRAAGSLTALYNGEEERGAVEPRGYDRYRFFLGSAEAKQPQKVTIDVEPLTGKPAVWVACTPNEYPRQQAYLWAGDDAKAAGDSTSITFTTQDKKFTPGWLYIGVTGMGHVSAYTVRASWSPVEVPSAKVRLSEAPLQLQDGMEEQGQAAMGVVRQYSIQGDDPLEGRPVVVRVEVLTGAVRVCVAAVGLRGTRDAAQGACSGRSAVVNASGAAGSRVFALDLPAALVNDAAKAQGKADSSDLENDILIRVTGLLESDSTFAVRVLVAARASTIKADHSLVNDALGPACCADSDSSSMLAPPSLSRHYLRYVRPPTDAVAPDGLSLDLELQVYNDFPGTVKLGARLAKDSAADANGVFTWAEASSTKASSSVWDGRRLVLRTSLGELLDGVEEKVDLVRQGFWLEVQVEASGPLVFVLEFGDFLAAPASSSGAGGVVLRPHEFVRGSFNTSSSLGVRYEFSTPSEAKAGAWKLFVRSCYGRLSMRSPTLGAEAASSAADFTRLELPLPLTHQTGTAGVVTDSVLVLPARGEMGTAFELALLEAGDGAAGDSALGGLVLPVPPLLAPVTHAGIIAFAFNSTGLASGNAKSLRYTLIFVLRNDSEVIVNTSCGLQEAIRRGLAVPGVPLLVAASASRKAGTPRKLLIPSLSQTFKNSSLWVNVLVEAIGGDGHVLHARSYSAYELPVEQSRALVYSALNMSRSLAYMLFAFLAAGSCIVISGRRGVCVKACELPDVDLNGDGLTGVVSKKRPAGEEVELEVQYSQYQEREFRRRPETFARADASGEFRYVPPSV